MSTFAERMIGAAVLDVATYEEVEADKTATTQAMGVVLLSSLAQGVAGAALGGGIGLISQVGDLVESRLKRWVGAKEAGWVVPGHGGIMDRLDSLVFVFPLVYYVSRSWPET